MNKQHILKKCIVIFDKYLQISLKESMSLTLKQIFSKAEVASSNQEEQELFNQYRQLKFGAKDFSKQLREKIKSMPDFISSEVSKSDSKMSLSLVQDEELSISLALTQLDSTLEVVSHGELYTLEKRMNLIFGNQNVDKTNMPFSPASVVWLLSQVFRAVDFDVPVKTLLIEILTKEFSQSINEAYHKINEVFIEAGILPNLKPEIVIEKNEQGDTTKATEQSDSTEATGQKPTNRLSGSPASGSAAQATTGSEGDQQESATKLLTTAEQQQRYDQESKKLVESIFNMLSPPLGSAVNKDGSDKNVPNNIADTDFDQALEQISKESGVVATSKNIHHLKELLADQVRNNTGNFYPELSNKQNNTLDLMGMVYDEIERDDSIDTHIRSSFNAINVPLLRTALNDESFFFNSAHPARKFMELLVESSQKWHGTNVIKKVHQYSDSVAKSFDGSATSFVKALDELSEYLKVTDKRAVSAEKKWVSAAQGKEKMDLTRAEVESHLNEILKGCEIKFVKDILTHVWRDSLTLTLLREGKDSEQWNKKIEAAKTLSKIGDKHSFLKLTGPEKISALHQLDQTMDELGFSKRDRVSTKDNIHACLGWQESDEKEKEKSPKLKKVLSIDDAVKSENVESANKKIEEIRELSDEEKAMKEKVVNLPYGTMFDFVINQQNETLRRKLSWVSTMSESVLFVDLVGRHPHKMKLPRLAIDLCRKNIIRVELPKSGYFKTALNKIINRLKKVAA